MDYGRIIFAIIGFSASFLFCLPNLQKWRKQEIAREKLEILSEALENADKRVVGFQIRHDDLLRQVCSYYLCHQELVESMAGARAAMNEALEFALRLRNIQLKMLICFPEDADDLVSVLDVSSENSRRRRLRSN